MPNVMSLSALDSEIFQDSAYGERFSPQRANSQLFPALTYATQQLLCPQCPLTTNPPPLPGVSDGSGLAAHLPNLYPGRTDGGYSIRSRAPLPLGRHHQLRLLPRPEEDALLSQPAGLSRYVSYGEICASRLHFGAVLRKFHWSSKAF